MQLQKLAGSFPKFAEYQQEFGERLVDLAADGALATDKLRARLRDLRIKKYEIRTSLDSGASDSERLDHYLKVISSSMSTLVEPVHRNSNKSALLPPPLVELQKLADLVPNLIASATPVEPVSRSLRRRLKPALVKQIASEYESGATTPSLCETYGLSKTGILCLLRDEGVKLRRRPLTDDQVTPTKTLYERDRPIAAIATRYNNVRQRLIKEGVHLRARGGSYR